MFRNRLYYHIKPLVPVNLRLSIRRRFALNKLKRVSDSWPVLPGSERPPQGWPGWPDGKKFAVVLTHDVEGPKGVAKCRQLMQLEQSLGFRSSFNFIPEGDYSVARELREELTANGFEVGVHDLRHDGKLYQSKEKFAENARRINHYLQEWGAVGFRSGFMLHNLDWLRQLNVQYEASTFDTDPFEPQPDAAGTIFPFWVSRFDGSATQSSGYVELPYTLPQDSTLFLVMRETSPEIWLKKLDWVASHGGMVLVNVHPDYLRFTGEDGSVATFPAEFYQQLLEYVRRKYGQSFWQPLPRELAEWYRQTVSQNNKVVAAGGDDVKVGGQTLPMEKTLRGKRAAVLLYSKISSDARPRRELEALLDEGMSVDLFCLQENVAGPLDEIRGALRVTRIPIRHERSRKSGYFQKYGQFFLHSFAAVTFRSFRRRYDLVHVHNMPDALVFAALVPRLLGAKIVLDLHDPMPELYQTIYKMRPNGKMVRLLKRLEQWSIQFAHLVLTPNESFRRLFCLRSSCRCQCLTAKLNEPVRQMVCPPDCSFSKIRIVMNTPDENIFKPVHPDLTPAPAGAAAKAEFRLMYHGLIAERHGLRTAIEAVGKLAGDVPGIVMDMFGERNAFLDETMLAVKKMGLDERIRYQGIRRLDDIPAAILETDLGIIPNLRTPFTEINFPTRIFEYLCMGKPVIVPDTKGIRDYFEANQILFFEPGNPDDLARVIRWVYEHPAETAGFVERGRKVYEQHHWSLEKKQFVKLMHSLVHNGA